MTEKAFHEKRKKVKSWMNKKYESMKPSYYLIVPKVSKSLKHDKSPKILLFLLKLNPISNANFLCILRKSKALIGYYKE